MSQSVFENYAKVKSMGGVVRLLVSELKGRIKTTYRSVNSVTRNVHLGLFKYAYSSYTVVSITWPISA